MHAIGGYFSLELPYGFSYHGENALKLNTGRNCLEYILIRRKYKRVYIPYYTCDAILEPFHKHNIEYIYYHINQSFEIIDDIELALGEGLLYINYWGINQNHVAYYIGKYGNRLIVDNTQAFFSIPFKGIDTFYTCRKFFGVPDGAYLYTDNQCLEGIPVSYSYDKASYLLKRIDISPEAAYDDFHDAENKLSNQSIKRMSALTDRIMHSINYSDCIKKRRYNFNFLHNCLGGTNLLNISFSEDDVPMVYPYLIDDTSLRSKLIKNRIYIPRYWPDVEKRCNGNDVEIFLMNHIFPLPIDQRYGKKEMLYIINLINRDV